MKIDNIDLTQQFNLSIFSDFRYQSIKITWLLPISIDWLIRALHHEFSNQNFNLIFGNSTLQEAIKYKKKTTSLEEKNMKNTLQKQNVPQRESNWVSVAET